MSIWTLDELQQLIDALKARLFEDPFGTLGSVSINGRAVSYRSVAELKELVNFYADEKARLQRAAAGQGRHGFSVARFP